MNKELSPIERMIDQACGHCPSLPVRREPTDEQKAAAYEIAQRVIFHIDEMYPGMWRGAAKTARVSIRNTIVAEVEQALVNQS
jgi:hypothetical protein